MFAIQNSYVIKKTLSAKLLEISTITDQSFNVFTMASLSDLKVHKKSLLLSDRRVQAREWLKLLKKDWEDLTFGLQNATILILAGRHGQEDGAIGDAEFFQDKTSGEKKNVLVYNHENLVCSFNTLNQKHVDCLVKTLKVCICIKITFAFAD